MNDVLKSRSEPVRYECDGYNVIVFGKARGAHSHALRNELRTQTPKMASAAERNCAIRSRAGLDMKNRRHGLLALAALRLADLVDKTSIASCRRRIVRAARVVRRLPLLLAPLAVLSSAPAGGQPIQYDFTYTVTSSATLWHPGSTYKVFLNVKNASPNVTIPAGAKFVAAGEVASVGASTPTLVLVSGSTQFSGGPITGGSCTIFSTTNPSNPFNWQCSGGQFTGAFNPGDTFKFEIQFTVASTSVSGQRRFCYFLAQLDGGGVDTVNPVSVGAPVCGDVTIMPRYDIKLSKAPRFGKGSSVWYVNQQNYFGISVQQNSGAVPPPGSVITVTDIVPPEFQAGLINSPPWQCPSAATNNITCTYTLGSFPPPTLNIPVKPLQAQWTASEWAKYCNGAGVTLKGPANNPGSVADANSVNNHMLPVCAPVAGYDLQIKKTPLPDNNTPWNIGALNYFRLKVSKVVPSADIPVGSVITVSDDISNVFQVGNGSGGTQSFGPPVWTCTWGPYSSTGPTTVICSHTTTGPFTSSPNLDIPVRAVKSWWNTSNNNWGGVSNTAKVTLAGPAGSDPIIDANTVNNEHSDSVYVLGYDLRITKEANGTNWPVAAGPVSIPPPPDKTYTIKLINNGATIGPGGLTLPTGPIWVFDEIPEGMTYNGFSRTNWGPCVPKFGSNMIPNPVGPTIVGCAYNYNGGSVAYNATFPGPLTIKVKPTAPGVDIQNTVRIGAPDTPVPKATLPAGVVVLSNNVLSDAFAPNNEARATVTIKSGQPGELTPMAGDEAKRSCPQGTQPQGSECIKPPEKIACRPPMVANAAGVCDCPPGMQKRGRECIKSPQCGPLMVLDPRTKTCVCEPGTTRRGRECVKAPDCKAPMIVNRAGVCACPEGTRQQGRECLRAPACRPPMIPNPRGVGCICPPGMTQRGEECVRATVPGAPARPAAPATPEPRGR